MQKLRKENQNGRLTIGIGYQPVERKWGHFHRLDSYPTCLLGFVILERSFWPSILKLSTVNKLLCSLSTFWLVLLIQLYKSSNPNKCFFLSFDKFNFEIDGYCQLFLSNITKLLRDNPYIWNERKATQYSDLNRCIIIFLNQSNVISFSRSRKALKFPRLSITWQKQKEDPIQQGDYSSCFWCYWFESIYSTNRHQNTTWCCS